MHKKMCIPLKRTSRRSEMEDDMAGVREENKSSLSYKGSSIYINDEIQEDDGIIFEQILEEIFDSYEEKGILMNIDIHINSEGGSVDAGLNIISQIENLKANGTKVNTIIKEKAFSMAFLIAICGTHREMRKYAKLILHPSWYLIEGEVPLTITTMRKWVENTNETWKIFCDIVSSQTKITQKMLDKIYKSGEDYEINSTKALEFGCVDTIL